MHARLYQSCIMSAGRFLDWSVHLFEWFVTLFWSDTPLQEWNSHHSLLKSHLRDNSTSKECFYFHFLERTISWSQHAEWHFKSYVQAYICRIPSSRGNLANWFCYPRLFLFVPQPVQEINVHYTQTSSKKQTQLVCCLFKVYRVDSWSIVPDNCKQGE